MILNMETRKLALLLNEEKPKVETTTRNPMHPELGIPEKKSVPKPCVSFHTLYYG